jgi:hypothetical protein
MLAVVWHFWLGLILLITGGLALLGLAAGYVKKVSSMRYPGKGQRRAQG